MSISYPYPLPPSYYPPVPGAAATAIAPEPVFTPVPEVVPVVAVKPLTFAATMAKVAEKDWPVNAKGKPISRQALWKRQQKEKLQNGR